MRMKIEKFSWAGTAQRTRLYVEQTTLILLHLTLIGSQYAMIFSQ